MDPNKVDIQCCNNLPLLLVGKNEHPTMNLIFISDPSHFSPNL